MRNKRIWLFLDDIRIPTDERWVVVKNYDEFVAHIRMNGLENYEIISLDHDLGHTAMVEYYTNAKTNYQINYENIEEKTGLDCAKFLVAESMNTGIPIPQIFVHSANPIGAANIMGYVNNYLKSFCKLPMVCVQSHIPHYIPEDLHMTEVEREAIWNAKNKKD
jgi:hypothetical protein